MKEPDYSKKINQILIELVKSNRKTDVIIELLSKFLKNQAEESAKETEQCK